MINIRIFPPFRPGGLFWLVLTLLLVAQSACARIEPAVQPTPTASQPPATATAQPTSTPTIVWFPPTSTPTPLPTLPPPPPTPDQRPNLGPLLFTDTFSTESPWALTRIAAGQIAFGKNELTIALSGGKAYLSSLRNEPILRDFYAEVTASPTLCQGNDEYGLLLRTASFYDFYRFAITCDSHVRLDRVFRGQTASPQPLAYADAIPPGAPVTLRLGIWAQGREMRFFINDVYLFTVRDGTFQSGQLGIFAHTNRDNPLTVSFSNLSVYTLQKP